MSDPREYTVGWICAITTEFVAAQAFFDEEHEGPERVSQNDDNNYALGRIGKHKVVVAVLPDGEYGTASAAAVARDMLHSFPNIRIGLMVGIGGGAPTEKRDIRLGDVVVSSPTDDKGGVFQYDFGKTIQDQSFQQKGLLNQPPRVLRTAVSGLKAQYKLKGHHLSDNIDTALKNINKRKKYVRPPITADRLYQSDFVHDPTRPTCCGETGGDDVSYLKPRVAERDEEEYDPPIHYGLIASSNQLMKDAQIRDKLADEREILCFEMESAGLMNHFPCLVIRGICDYSDSHKNKEWQGFAAMMAAAYAKDLLLQIRQSDVEAQNRISEKLDLITEDLERISSDVHETQAMIEARDSKRHLREIERWLSPPNPSVNANHAKKNRHQGTGEWFLESQAFKDWYSGSKRHLWLHGLAGGGKTVLSTTVLDKLDELAKTDKHIILRFFFDFRNATKQTLEAMLRSLAHQLYVSGIHTAEHLDSAFQEGRSGQAEPTIETLLDVVSKMLTSQQRVFIVLGALDESTTRDELLGWIKGVQSSTELNNVQLMHTSRPEAEFIASLPLLLGEENCLELNKEAINVDIRSYVEARLKQDDKLVRKKMPKDLRQQIRDTVGGGADGMFRWAACQMDSLANCPSPKAVRAALAQLPKDLTETYERMLSNIPRDLKGNAIRVLQFLVHCEQALTLSEVVDIIATEVEEEPRGFDIYGRVFSQDEVLRHCPGLVSVVDVITYEGSKQQLHLAHFSVKEFLLKKDAFSLKGSAIVMTKTCLAYLASINDRHSKTNKCFPMAEHAAAFWMGYAFMAEEPEDVIQEAVKFLLEETTFRRWGRLYEPAEDWGRMTRANMSNRLYYAAYHNLKAIVKALLPHVADLDAGGGLGGNALQIASAKGHKDIVQQLLEVGADVNAGGVETGKPLMLASLYGYEDVVQQLLEAGADVNLYHREDGSALQAASAGGHKGVVQKLLKAGVDVDARADLLPAPIHLAFLLGREDIAQLLLEAGADVNARDTELGTLVCEATTGKDWAEVEEKIRQRYAGRC